MPGGAGLAMSWKSVVAAALLGLALIHAQASPQPNQPIAFEIASVKPTVSSAFTDPGSSKPGGRWSAIDTTLMTFIRTAYPEYRSPGLIVGGPRWINERRFDIEAKAPMPAPTSEQYRLMLRQLLRDRFNLNVRVTQQPADVYVLVVMRADGRLGPGLKPASAACVAEYESGRLKPQVVPPLQIDSAPQPRAPQPCMAATHERRNLRRTFGTWSFDATLGMLQLLVDRKIVDRTGLKGFYNINLEYDQRSTRPPDGANDLGVSIFTAVQEQLGLRLERRREPTEVLVIESADMPSGN